GQFHRAVSCILLRFARKIIRKIVSRKKFSRSGELKAKPEDGRPYSYASASMGSFCAALNAGYSAPAMALATAIRAARAIHPPDTITWSRGSFWARIARAARL